MQGRTRASSSVSPQKDLGLSLTPAPSPDNTFPLVPRIHDESKLSVAVVEPSTIKL